MAAAASVNAIVDPSAVAEVNRDIRATSLLLLAQGQVSLAILVLTTRATTVPRVSGDAMWVVINDDNHVLRDVVVGDPVLLADFHGCIRRHLRVLPLLQRAGYEEHVVSHMFRFEVLRAGQRAAGLLPPAAAAAAAAADDEEEEEEIAQPYRCAVPASSAAVRSLEKQTFRAAARGNGDAITKCGICFDEFVDGAEVSVMPCPCHGHRFHTDCIAKWLGISNMCPLCRHELPPAEC